MSLYNFIMLRKHRINYRRNKIKGSGWFDDITNGINNVGNTIKNGIVNTLDPTKNGVADKLNETFNPIDHHFIFPEKGISQDVMDEQDGTSFSYVFWNKYKRLPNADELKKGIEKTRLANTNALIDKLKAVKNIEPQRYTDIMINYCKKKYGYWEDKSNWKMAIEEWASIFGGPKQFIQIAWSIIFAASLTVDVQVVALLMVSQAAISNIANNEIMNFLTEAKIKDANFIDAITKANIQIPNIENTVQTNTEEQVHTGWVDISSSQKGYISEDGIMHYVIRNTDGTSKLIPPI